MFTTLITLWILSSVFCLWSYIHIEVNILELDVPLSTFMIMLFVACIPLANLIIVLLSYFRSKEKPVVLFKARKK